jgi:hypothetical protein
MRIKRPDQTEVANRRTRAEQKLILAEMHIEIVQQAAEMTNGIEIESQGTGE